MNNPGKKGNTRSNLIIIVGLLIALIAGIGIGIWYQKVSSESEAVATQIPPEVDQNETDLLGSIEVYDLIGDVSLETPEGAVKVEKGASYQVYLEITSQQNG